MKPDKPKGNRKKQQQILQWLILELKRLFLTLIDIPAHTYMQTASIKSKKLQQLRVDLMG